jgi:hypothetical protein
VAAESGEGAGAGAGSVGGAGTGTGTGTRKHPRAEEPKPGHPSSAPRVSKPAKKRRKSESKRGPLKPTLSAEGRLRAVVTASRRDFLVVELVRPHGQVGVSDDPDEVVALAKTGKNQEGEEHSVSSFMRAEKLEFSSLRHAKFSTMLLLHALHADVMPPERYSESKAEEARWAAEAAAAEAIIAAAEAKVSDARDQRLLRVHARTHVHARARTSHCKRKPLQTQATASASARNCLRFFSRAANSSHLTHSEFPHQQPHSVDCRGCAAQG